jgi:hypothetical protein
MRVSEAFYVESEPEPAPSRGPDPVLVPQHSVPGLGKPAESRLALLAPSTAESFEVAVARIKELARVDIKALTTAEEAGALHLRFEEGTQIVRQIEVWRKAAVDPLNKKVKTINALCKEPSETLQKGFLARAWKALLAWTEQEAARVRREQEAAQRAQEEAARAEAEATARAEAAETPDERREALQAAEAASVAQSEALVAAPVEPVKAFRGDAGTTTPRSVWKFEIVKAELVPAQYLTVDESLVRKAIAAGVREIPGINISEEKIPVTRLS